MKSFGHGRTYDQFVRAVTLDGQREFGKDTHLQDEYNKGFSAYSSRGPISPGLKSHAYTLGHNDAHEQDRW